ncbi:hypothetical protein Saso_66420 [Streptomyces asoensis]|uniref:Uncharacterized protein n=1 Tax=Streptomyces asoensis TaxID=249586 RepID=A0ABQ3SA41_9ACTN|nr:hypothetical protein GCM10010496_71040 [Streptomyces asoensis]GHI64992.1 hypothetical protein Saso_66420 [Streptomyces asoensis]
MAWFGKGETLGKLLVKVRADRVSSEYRGQQPRGSAWFHRAESGVAYRYGEQWHPGTAVTVESCGRDKWSLAQRRGALRRARKADSL